MTDWESKVAAMNGTEAPDGPIKVRDKFKGAKVNWEEAFKVLGQWWEIHVYGYAVCFFILFVWCTAHAIKAATRKKIPSRAYYVTLNILVAICSFGRTFYLLTLTYGTRQLVPKMVGLLPKFAMFPCITSSFIILFAVFMRLTKMRIIRESLFTTQKLIFITGANFILAYTVDILAEYIHNGAYFYFICDVYFVSWGLFSSIAFWWIFVRFYKRVVINRKKLNKMGNDAENSSTVSGASGKSTEKKSDHDLDTRIPTAAKITVVAGVAFFLIGAVNVYKFTVMFINFDKEVLSPALPWSWWLYNTFMRAFELVMNAMIAFVGCLPFYMTK